MEDMVDASSVEANAGIDIREVYFLILHFLSSGPCKKTSCKIWNELLEHDLLPRRYHAWYSRSGAPSGDNNDKGCSLPLSYPDLVRRYPHIQNDHLLKLLEQLILCSSSPTSGVAGCSSVNGADISTLLGSGSFSLLESDKDRQKKKTKYSDRYLRWPHMHTDQVRGLSLREIGGGFAKHHRAPSVRAACYAIAKPSTMVQKMQVTRKLRGHQNAVYCAIFDRSGRYVITGSDDRLVKIWSTETAFCLSSCRGHEGDITDLAVSSNNALVASASNDFIIRVWRVPDGLPISVLKGHTGVVTAIAFSPRPTSVYHLLSSSDDGTCRIWDARYSQSSLRVYTPKPLDVMPGRSSNPAPNSGQHIHQILCCAYNASGTVFVTGSSDTCARVWNACKTNSEPEDPNHPRHEMDVLSGHENDVNYVQFSGFSASSKFSFNDNLKEDNVPKFKNSWFIHDNIVTCSRDGSAIIWIPRSRRSHVKVGRWIRAFHLKVPPPPIPPQPARGGPRRRVQPTPRGVNMIVWSLDNRFVLAAIMDCRICVWNASDGSLVHSLIGHNQSTFVLDVHPFNPRMAMSAGYDGKTIIWDIWEGTPVRIYETGRFKLVDGKFSPDGTSVVLSDEVGQIFIIATGQGESQKDAKYDQFFLGDYRPLVQDIHGNSLDQETQLLPYRRNIQDLLCDSSMIPYPEPYQNMYQRRRLGALGIEWRPSSLTFAVGPSGNINNGDYQMLPIVDLERWVESLEAEPVFIDAMEWEQENEAQSDDSDSEYNVTEEVFCEIEDRPLSLCSSADQDCSEGSEDYNSSGDGLRRSKRKKYKSDVEVRAQLGRKMKRRNMDGHDDHATRIQRKGKPRTGKLSLKKKNSKCTPTRPQRRAAKNALTFLSEMSEASTDEEEEEDLDNSSSVNEDNDSSHQSQETETSFLNLQADYVEENKVEIGDTANAPPNEVQSSAGAKRKLILRLPIRDPKKLIEKNKIERIEQKDPMVSPAKKYSDSTKANETHLKSWEQGQSSTDRFVTVLSENNVGNGIEEHSEFEEQSAMPSEYKAEKVKRGEVETCLTKRMRRDDTLGASMDGASAVSDEGFYVPENENEHFKSKNVSQTSPSNSGNYEKGKDIYINSYEAVEQFHGGSALEHQHAFARKLPSLELLANDHQVATCSGNGKTETCVRTKNGIDCRTETICQEYRQYEVINKVNSRQDGKTTVFNEKGSDVSAQDAENNEKQCHGNTVPSNGYLSKAVDKSVRPCLRKLRIISKRSTDDPGSSSSRRDPSLENQKWPDRDFKSNSNVHGQNNLIPVDPADDVSIYGSSDNDEWSNKPTQLQHRIGKSIRKRSKRQSKRIAEDEMLHVDEIESTSNCKTLNGEHKDLNGASTSRLHHTRSSGKRTVTETSENGCTFYFDGHDSLHDRNPAPKVNIKLRFSGNKRENCNTYDLCPPDKRKSKQQVKKISWLMLSEHEEGYRYIPQLGDEVAYLRQGHAEYLDATGSQEIGPWEIVKGVLEAVEFCEVKGLKYATFPGSGESCCKLTLEFSNPSSQAFGETFKLTLPELVGFPDFLVERTRYDASIERNWTHRDKCNVWWRNEDGDGGSWWDGRIIAVKAKSTEFSESPWERYVVQYTNDSSEQHLHSPWELHDVYTQRGNPQLDDNSRTKLLSLFDKIEQTSLRNQDKHGIQRFDQVSQKSDFLNRFPVPLSFELIKRRLEYHYYRSLEAVKHDVAVMLSNAQSYFQKNTEVSAKVRRLSESIARALPP